MRGNHRAGHAAADDGDLDVVVAIQRREPLRALAAIHSQPNRTAVPQRARCHQPSSFRSFSIGRVSDRLPFSRSAHTSPAFLIRAGMLRTVKVFGFAAPFSSSFHVQGADTGAPALARTVYAVANVAL